MMLWEKQKWINNLKSLLKIRHLHQYNFNQVQIFLWKWLDSETADPQPELH